MNPQEQSKESLLLREHWALMQSGVCKAEINSSLYVKGMKYKVMFSPLDLYSILQPTLLIIPNKQ